MRRWLAKKLYPAAFADAERYDYQCRRLDELKRWCGYGFPEIRAAVEWVQRSERIHFMSLAEYDAAVATARETGNWSPLLGGDIDRFRDEISDRFDRRPSRTA